MRLQPPTACEFQLVLDVQDVFERLWPPAFRIENLGVRRKSGARCGRGRRFSTGYIAILMAETEPLMQAYYLHVKRRQAALMINEQRSKVRIRARS